jgi:hypothetical protein
MHCLRILLLAVAVVYAERSATPQCPPMPNQCSALCPPRDGSCCGAFGTIGYTEEVCGSGCQSGPCLEAGGPVTAGCDVGRCGLGCTCPEADQCCSADGYCGTGSSFVRLTWKLTIKCGTGCQFGACGEAGDASSSPTRVHYKGCTIYAAAGRCDGLCPCPNSADCCSRTGFCGSGDAYVCTFYLEH